MTATAWERWAIGAPIDAGINLAREACADVRRERRVRQREAARIVLAEGMETWSHGAALADVWPAIVDAAESHLRALAS
jgi:hypothetical protein